MKNPLLYICLPALLSLFAAQPALAVKGRPSAVSFLGAGSARNIHVFVKGDNAHLYENFFNGSTWAWIDHGLPDGTTGINNPKAVTYVDSTGNRRIYVFAVDNSGQLVILFHKGPGYTWQWSKQGGPWVSAHTLSATVYVDDSDVPHLYAFAFSTNSGAVPYRLVKHYWNGSAWVWSEMGNFPGHPYNSTSFTEATTYTGNDGQKRLDVFCAAGDSQVLLRHSLVNQSWSMTNLGGLVDTVNGSSVNYLNSASNREVLTFVRNTDYQTIWNRSAAGWSENGKPSEVAYDKQGLISASAYNTATGQPRVNLFVEWERHLYQRAWINSTWQAWQDLGRPSSASTSFTDGVKNTTAITFQVPGVGIQNTLVFMTGAQNDRLYVNWWNGSSWQWFDQGNP